MRIIACLKNAFVIPLLPAISFVLILVFGKRFKDGTLVHYLGIATVAVAFVLSLVAAGQWIDRSENVAADAHAEEFIGGSAATVAGDATLLLGTEATETEGEGGEHAPTAGPVINQITWLQSGGVEHQVGTYVDGLSVTLLVIVSLVSLLVHVYAAEYVKGDRRFVHFFAFLSLFTASMLFFVLSSSILQMIVGWELVGVCSFVLIGHWWEENENSNAALKAFLTNRVGDIGLIVGVIVLYFAAGTFDIFAINTMIANGEIRHLLLLVTALALTAAVMSKSGQFPLHTWLPDAMAGPTPVSALIHAATMVVAGVYLVARLYPVFYDGYAIESSSINVLAFVGGFTALMAAALAFAQWDIKKILAYSTVFPARLHDHGPRRGCVDSSTVPPVHPCAVQGLPVPWCRLGEPCRPPHLRYSRDGWVEETHACDVLDLCHLVFGARGNIPARGVLVEG